MEPTNSGEYVVAATKAAPSMSVASITAMGIPLQEWVYILTIVYTLMMMAHLVYKFIRDRTNGR